MLMIFARILSSWLPELQQYTVMKYIMAYTDPYLEIFRRIIPPLGMIDFSPIVALFALQFIEYGVKWLIITIGS